MIRRTITALAGAILATTLFAAAASADTLAGRAAPFTPAQAPGDQYTTPDAPAPPPQVGGEVTPTSTPSRERGNPDAEEVAGERATGDQVAAQAEPGGQVGARVEPGVRPDPPGEEAAAERARGHHADPQLARRGEQRGVDAGAPEGVLDGQRRDRVHGVRPPELLGGAVRQP